MQALLHVLVQNQNSAQESIAGTQLKSAIDGPLHLQVRPRSLLARFTVCKQSFFKKLVGLACADVMYTCHISITSYLSSYHK